MADLAPERAVLEAWAGGQLSPDDAFVRLYDLYAGTVRGWLAVRTSNAADDLFQDVWTIFYRRCAEWKHQAEFKDPEARPVLSFLFRTCHLVLSAHRRLQTRRSTEPLDGIRHPSIDGQSQAFQSIQLGECLAAAREHCSDEDCAVLTAKLAGVPAREIGRTLQLTEASVDHRFRNTIDSVREALSPRGRSVHV